MLLGVARMKYRGVEYSLDQGIGRAVWKWSATVDGVSITGLPAKRNGCYRSGPRPKSEGCPASISRLTEASYRRSSSSGCTQT
jgi:hypothetical protein